MIINEKLIHDELRAKLISRGDAIAWLIDMRYPAAEAECMVDEWIECWEFQKDFDEERANGWCRTSRLDEW